MKKLNVIRMCAVLCLGLPVAATMVTGCAGDRYSRSTGQYIDDKTLAMHVNSALNDNAEYKLGDVNVQVFRGTVQLSGFVNTRDQKEKAGQIAKGVEGVRGVENNLTVKPDTDQR